MKQMKERYIYDVVRRLPENQREEVSKELDANISDMMINNTDEELLRVITVLGEPRVLANEYREHKRYLISPKWMDDYIRTLKIAITVFVSLALVFGLFENVLNPTATTAIGIAWEVMINTFSSMVDAAFTAFALVTIVFIFIERYDLNPKKKTWNIKTLPELPKKDVLKVSKTASLVGLIFTIVFGVVLVYILYFNQDYIRVIYTAGSTNLSEPIFLNDAIMTYLPIFIISLLLNIGVLLAKFVQGYLGLKVMILQTIQKAFSFFAFLFFIQLSPLFNPDFISQVGTAIELTNDTILENIQSFFKVITVIGAIGVGIDIISTWVKYLKHQKETTKVSS